MEFLSLLMLFAAQQCPPEEDVYPCFCKLTQFGPSVYCSRLGTDLELEKALISLKDQRLYNLEIRGFNFSTVKPDLFKGLHIQSLHLEKIEVEDASFRPGRRHLQGLEESLETLSISKSFRNGHRSLGYLQLNHLKNLKHAIFEDNVIPEVDNDWFKGGPSGLTTLIFERNGIEVIGDKAFSSLLLLQTLAVAGNHIRELKRSMFPSPEFGIKTLDLAYNKLHELPSGMFAGMPKLQEVNLDNNLLHTLNENAFTPIIGGITSFSMNGNPLVCDKKLHWSCCFKEITIEGKCVSPASYAGETVHYFCSLKSSNLS